MLSVRIFSAGTFIMPARCSTMVSVMAMACTRPGPRTAVLDAVFVLVMAIEVRTFGTFCFHKQSIRKDPEITSR